MGCETTIDVANLETQVTSVGPIEASSLVQLDDDTQGFSQVRIGYSLRDYEGDDASIQVEICEVGEDSNCGIPFRGFGGDGLSRLPTIPVDTDVPHIYEWAPGCGRIVGLERVETSLDISYFARISIAGGEGEPVESPEFLLSDLGFDAETEIPCSREI